MEPSDNVCVSTQIFSYSTTIEQFDVSISKYVEKNEVYFKQYRVEKLGEGGGGARRDNLSRHHIKAPLL